MGFSSTEREKEADSSVAWVSSRGPVRSLGALPSRFGARGFGQVGAVRILRGSMEMEEVRVGPGPPGGSMRRRWAGPRAGRGMRRVCQLPEEMGMRTEDASVAWVLK